jgi:hypothetical protein
MPRSANAFGGTVDGRNPAPLGGWKRLKQHDKEKKYLGKKTFIPIHSFVHSFIAFIHCKHPLHSFIAFFHCIHCIAFIHSFIQKLGCNQKTTKKIIYNSMVWVV